MRLTQSCNINISIRLTTDILAYRAWLIGRSKVGFCTLPGFCSFFTLSICILFCLPNTYVLCTGTNVQMYLYEYAHDGLAAKIFLITQQLNIQYSEHISLCQRKNVYMRFAVRSSQFRNSAVCNFAILWTKKTIVSLWKLLHVEKLRTSV